MKMYETRYNILCIQRKIAFENRFTVGKFGVSFLRVIVAFRTDVTGRESAATKALQGRIVRSSPTSPRQPLTLTTLTLHYQNNAYKLFNLFMSVFGNNSYCSKWFLMSLFYE